MKFNKNQLEIIAYCLSIQESECENKETRVQMQNMLGDMQEKGIWGTYAMFYNECEICEDILSDSYLESGVCDDCKDSINLLDPSINTI